VFSGLAEDTDLCGVWVQKILPFRESSFLTKDLC